MAYIRKTRDIWVIRANYGYGWEDECTYDNYREAKADLATYRNEGGGEYRLYKRRVKIDGTDTRR